MHNLGTRPGTATQGLLGKVVWPKEGVTLYNGVVLGTRLAQVGGRGLWFLS